MSHYALVQFRSVQGRSGQFRSVQFSWSPCMHDVAVGNAREGDGMDAATRWGVA